MSFTLSPNIGLWLPTPGTAEPIDQTKLASNFTLIDTLLRSVSCDTLTRPSSPFPGQMIWETDTMLLRRRNDANSSWVTVAQLAITKTSSTAPSSPTQGQMYWESDSGTLVVRSSGGTWQHTSIPAISSTSVIVAPTTGKIVFDTTAKTLLRYTGSNWSPLVHADYFTFRFGTTTSVSNAAWTAIPFATVGEGSLAGISTSDNITFQFDEPGTWTVGCSLGSNANQGFIGALIRGTVTDPFNATNSETYAIQSAPAIQTVAGVTMMADIRVATGGTRNVKCVAISTSAAFNLTSSGPMKPRISFRWSPL